MKRQNWYRDSFALASLRKEKIWKIDKIKCCIIRTTSDEAVRQEKKKSEKKKKKRTRNENKEEIRWPPHPTKIQYWKQLRRSFRRLIFLEYSLCTAPPYRCGKTKYKRQIEISVLKRWHTFNHLGLNSKTCRLCSRLVSTFHFAIRTMQGN